MRISRDYRLLLKKAGQGKIKILILWVLLWSLHKLIGNGDDSQGHQNQ